MDKPIVAIVGRPNVGKSALFNKLIGRRMSIVEDTPGVTRDRLYADCEWGGRIFTLIDTGGIEPQAGTEMLNMMREQAEVAIDTADLVVLVTDVQIGVTAADDEVADMLKKAKKEVILCVNKVDRPGELPPEYFEFYNMGLGDPSPVSAVQGLGIGDLLDRIVGNLPGDPVAPDDDERVKVAILGKPNAGKSSLLNQILGEERAIVSEVAGTTRDAIDADYDLEGKKYTLIDTAGIRKRSRVNERIERYSVMRANLAVSRSDVCIIMIDALEGVTEQDTKIAGLAHEEGKAVIIAVNKWDAVEKETKTMDEYRLRVRGDLAFMPYAPIIFISALCGTRVRDLFPLIDYVYEQNSMRISTGKLNEILSEAVAKVQPPTDKGKRLKVLFITQVSIKPPTFVIFCNRADLFHFSYQRYIENQIRSVFSLEGTPVRIIIRERKRDG